MPSTAKQTIRVLLVEDNPGDVGIIRRALAGYGRVDFAVDSVPSVKECRQTLETAPFDVLLLDYSLPGESGLDFLRSLDESQAVPPVIMLTGQGDERVAKEAIRSGAYDYFPKDSIESDALGSAILESLEKARLEAEERRQREDDGRLAQVDPLTGLYNRRYLDEALARECNRAKRYGNDLSCLMIDLDGFKQCNDIHGHLEGDALLRQVAAMISSSVRESDVAARYGGDEFCIVLPETSQDQALLLAERLRSEVATIKRGSNGQSLSIGASIGVFSPQRADDLEPEKIIGFADAALREAKAAGKDQVRAYTPSSATAA